MVTDKLIEKIKTETITTEEAAALLAWLKQQPDVVGTAHEGYLVRREFGTVGVGTYSTHTKEFKAFYLPPVPAHNVDVRPVSERWSQSIPFNGEPVAVEETEQNYYGDLR